MDIITFYLAVFLVIFAWVLLFGAPYLPTMKPQIETALDLLELKKGQTILELGCGDGRVLKAAAKRGYKAVGYELNPLLVLVSRAVTWPYRDKVKVVWANYWRAEWPPADGIFVFLLDPYMKKLDKKITQAYNGQKVKLASFAFKVPNKKITNQKNGVYLYTYN